MVVMMNSDSDDDPVVKYGTAMKLPDNTSKLAMMMSFGHSICIEFHHQTSSIKNISNIKGQ